MTNSHRTDWFYKFCFSSFSPSMTFLFHRKQKPREKTTRMVQSEMPQIVKWEQRRKPDSSWSRSLRRLLHILQRTMRDGISVSTRQISFPERGIFLPRISFLRSLRKLSFLPGALTHARFAFSREAKFQVSQVCSVYPMLINCLFFFLQLSPFPTSLSRSFSFPSSMFLSFSPYNWSIDTLPERRKDYFLLHF